jgi:16S rRNA (cytidine1402-2'-O)-methyltransferase
MGTLYLVATPIGNLEDITARALRVLRQALLIAAEDTRHTRKLLAHFDIHTPLTSYHAHSRRSRLEHVLAALEAGDVALVSDAGTPALNDPGYELVRAALQAGYPVSPVPGASAPLAALVASGLPTDDFLYLGYLPRKASDRQRRLEEIAGLPYTLIFLETPHRLREALADLQAVLGDRQIAAARELTKLHEEFFRGSLSAAQAHFAAQEPRGEFTLVVAGAPPAAQAWGQAEVAAALQAALAQGLSPSRAAARVAAQAGWPRKQVYLQALQLQPRDSSQSGPGTP